MIALGLSMLPLGLVAGCAGWSSLGQAGTSLSSALWKRSGPATTTPGYDLYADTGTAARAQLESDEQLADNQAKSRRTQAVAEDPAADLVAQRESEQEKAATTRRNRARTGDTSIRVTLGRPESLPTLKDPVDTAGPMLASTSTGNWKRGASGSGERAARPARPAPPRAAGEARERVDLAAAQRSTDRERQLQEVLTTARERLDALSTYRVNITRVERVGATLQPEEDVVLNIRRKPKAVLLQWTKGPSQGREVIYSAAINNRMMYVNSGNSALPIPRMTLPVDSPLVLKSSRHPITEAGFDTIFENLFKFLEPRNTPDAADGKLVYKGLERPPGLSEPCHLVERVTPKGETWKVYLDDRTFMPALVSAANTKTGELIERYIYRDLNPNPAELAAADTFDPDRRWGAPKGLLSRLARAAGAAPGTAAAQAGSRQTTTR